MPRDFQVKANDRLLPCPKCGNNTRFTAHSRQCQEDACEVWVTCGGQTGRGRMCRFDPFAHDSGLKLEDTMGGTHTENALAALGCWNDAVADCVARAERRDAPPTQKA